MLAAVPGATTNFRVRRIAPDVVMSAMHIRIFFSS
jgi:hypothetical protein